MKKKYLLLGLLLLLPFIVKASLPNNKATLINLEGTKKVVIIGSAESNFYTGKLGYHLMTNLLGGTGVIYQTPALFETSLATAIGTSDTSMTLVTGTDKSGNALSGNYCFTIDGGLSNAEYVCGSAASATITGMTRGIGSNGVTSIAGLTFSHRYGADVKITDFPVLQQYGRILNGQDTTPGGLTLGTNTITGLTSLNLGGSGVITGLSTSTPSGDTKAASQYYVNNALVSGAPDATESAKGNSELATQAEMAAGTATGTTAANLVLQSKYAKASSSATTIIPITNTSGKIDPSFLNGTENYTFNGTTTIAPALVNIPPVGSVTAYASSTAPTGWLLCDGSAIATSTYSSLFAIIGRTFGGNGNSTFAVPDLRGRQIIMASSTATYATSTGVVGGEKSHTQTEAELAPHTHTVGIGLSGINAARASGYMTNDSPSTFNSGSAGSGTPFNVLDPYLTLYYIIKY